MAAAGSITERITISDFRPGIFSDYAGSSILLANGAATVDNTYRCCADRTGALIAMPKVTPWVTYPLPGDANGEYPAATPGLYALDVSVLDNIRHPFRNTLNQILDEGISVFVAFGWNYYWTGGALNGDRREYMKVVHVREFDGTTPPPVRDVAISRGDANLDTYTGQSPSPPELEKVSSMNFATLIGDQVANTARLSMRIWVAAAAYMQWVSGGNLVQEELDAGFWDRGVLSQLTPRTLKRTLIGFAPVDEAVDGPTEQASNRVGADGEFSHVVTVLGHQARLVGVEEFDNKWTTGNNTAVPPGNLANFQPPNRPFASLSYAPPLQVRGTGSVLFPYPENLSLIGTAASLSADEMILIHHRHGALLIRGDLDNPTISRAPFIESTYGVNSIPTHTPLGLVYGTRNGVFVWEGGETSRHLSPQLEGFFWNHRPNDTVDPYSGNRGRFAWWHPWVLAPNNWAYDTRHESWWCIEPPVDTDRAFNAYETTSQDQNGLIALSNRISATNTTLLSRARADVLSDTYRWESQPLVETRERFVSLRDVTIVASMAAPHASPSRQAEITVNLTGFKEDGTVWTSGDVKFNLDGTSNKPQMLNKPTAGTLSHVQVRVDVQSSHPDQPAPKIHSISLGLTERQRIPQQT